MNIEDAFNFGMAEWGKTGEVPREAFARVVELHRMDDGEASGANYLQCLAVAYWAVGEPDRAMALARRAKIEAGATLRPTFSCWRYRTVSTQDFQQDTESVMQLIGGETGVVPAFWKFVPESP